MATDGVTRDLVFVSYCHLDKEWKDKLLVLLKPYVKKGHLQVWADDYMQVGDLWRREIDGALARTRVGLLLVSPDFQASDFIMDVEVPQLVGAAQRKELSLCCIPVRTVNVDVLAELAQFQWTQPYEPPLDRLPGPEREHQLVLAVQKLVRLYGAGAEEAARADAAAVADKATASVRELEALPRGAARAGLLHGVPALPPHFVAPAEALGRLKRAILEEQAPALGITAAAREGLYGQGGIGKTVLAAALAQDAEVQRAFADGIFWVTLGQAPELVGLQRMLEHQRSGAWRDFETRHVGTSALRDAFGSLNCLLVLDDVWHSDHADAFQILGPRGRLLVTTRDRALLEGLGARVQSLDVLAPDAALELLAQWAGVPRAALPEQATAIAKECGHLPLALALAGAQVRGGIAWEDVLSALEQGNLRFLDHPHGSIFKSLSASVSALPPEQAARYAELAIFPEDTPIPGPVIERLWSAAGLSALDTRQLLVRFDQRALLRLDGDTGARQVRFHDLQGDYLRLLVSDVPALHGRLLDACEAALPSGATSAERWAALPEHESYLWQHLVYHALEAARGAWLEALVGDAGWLAAKARASGVSLLQADLARIAERLPTERIRAVERAVRLESSWLHQQPEAVHELIYNRLRAEGRSPQEIHATLTRLRPRARLVHPVNLGGAELRQFRGHSGAVTACAYSPDGSRILSASTDNTLREWDRASGKELRRFEGHSDSMRACAYSPDGCRILSGSDDKSLREWDCDTGKELRRFEGHSDFVRACAYSPDGCRILSASRDKSLREWDCDTGKELRRFEGHSSRIDACTYSPDGSRILSASGDRTLREWDRATGEELRRFEGHASVVRTCAYSPDGSRILSGSDDKSLREWDRASGKELHRFEGHSGFVSSCTYSPDGSRILSGSDDKSLREWERTSSDDLRRFEGHSDSVTACAYSPDGTRILSASSDETLREWERATGKELHRFQGNWSRVNACAYSPDGTRILSASSDKILREWDRATGKELRRVVASPFVVVSCAYAPDGTRILSASSDKTLREWDCASGKELRRFEGHSNAVTACSYSFDGTRVLSASWDETVREWDRATGKELRRFEGHSNVVTACAYALDGTRILSASWDQTVREWDRATGDELRRFEGHSAAVRACAYSPDGTRILSASSDSTIKIWQRDSGRCVLTVYCTTFNALAIVRGQIAAGDALGNVWLLDIDELT